MTPMTDEHESAACTDCGAPVAPGAARCAAHDGTWAQQRPASATPWSTWPEASPQPESAWTGAAPATWPGWPEAAPATPPAQAPPAPPAQGGWPQPAPPVAPAPGAWPPQAPASWPGVAQSAPPAVQAPPQGQGPAWPPPAPPGWGGQPPAAQAGWPVPYAAPKRKTRRVVVTVVVAFVIFAVLAALAATGLQDADQQAATLVSKYEAGTGQVDFSAVDAGFRATFPTQPKRHDTSVDSPAVIDFAQYISAKGPVAFMAESFRVKPGYTYDLDAGLRASAKGAKATLEAAVPTTFNGFPAIEGIYSKSGTHFKSMIVQTPGRVYMLIVGGKGNPPAGYEKFKSSFQITP